jgi:hypothetical protein
MKATLEQLRQIDWKRFNNGKRIKFENQYFEVVGAEWNNDVDVRVRNGISGALLTRDVSGEWKIHKYSVTFAQVKELDAIANSIDEFIAREVALMNRPPVGDWFEEIDADTARACENATYQVFFRGSWDGAWTSVDTCEYAYGWPYIFRRPIAKPLPNPGTGFELCDRDSATEYTTFSLTDEVWRLDWLNISCCLDFSDLTYAYRRPITKPIQLTITNPQTLLRPNTIAIIDGVAYTVEKSVRVGDIETAELKRIQPTKPS